MRDREESLGGRRSNSSSKGRTAKFYDNEHLSTDEIEPFKLNRMSDPALVNAYYNLLKASSIENMTVPN